MGKKEILERRKILVKVISSFPDHKDLTLAKKISKDYPNLFPGVEATRAAVRKLRGHMGNAKRKHADPDLKTPVTYDTTSFRMPPSDAKVRTPFVLPVANNNILFLSDIHIPYQINNAVKLALKYGKEKGVNTIYLNGDIVDMFQASFHEKDPRERNLKYEIDMAGEFLDMLAEEFPRAKIYWKEGNHEIRLKRYLMVKAPELLDLDVFEIPELLKFGERGIGWIPNRQLTLAGKLYLLHGNEFKGAGNVNPARTYYLRSKMSMIAGDKHRTSEHTEANLDGSIVTCWSAGCLCELSPDYLPYGHNWNWGFAHIKTTRSGNFEVFNKRIVNNMVV